VAVKEWEVAMAGPDPATLAFSTRNLHLTDSSLGVAGLTARHGITPRYLHKLFEDDAMTYSQYVVDQRLALAYRRLRSPRFAARTVSSIAYDAGLGDLSYFNRTFRRRYGITPSGARARSPG
jgi:AraC-like DNA-binding protein